MFTRIRSLFKRAPKEGLAALTDRQLVLAIQRQALSAYAMTRYLLGEIEPPRGFPKTTLKGPKRRALIAAKEDLGQTLSGLGHLEGRLHARPRKKAKRDATPKAKK